MRKGREAVNVKDPRSVQIRLFRCGECGAITPACKISGKTERGHPKHFWCFACQEERKQIQIE